ncbi:MAG TPA: hypothetical protein VG324_04510 [Blastocatellia bacterium]|nr:hypothetical protein [Blastocatellia bacterium]
MIFSCILRRLFLLLLFAVVSVSPDNADAQCPGGKPPNRDGSCGRSQEKKPAASAHEPKQSRQNDSAGANRPRPKRSRKEGGANICSINVLVIKQGGGTVADVNLALDDSSQSAGVTGATGAYKFTKLPCKRNYKVTPAHPELTFNLASITIANLRKNGSAVFIAAPRGIIASRPPRKGSGPCNPAPKTLPKIKFDNPVTGRLSPQTSWCDEIAKGYFHLYQLDGAFGGDIIQFNLQSDGAAGASGQSSDLRVQVIDRTGNEIAPNGESDDPSGRQLILPTAGDYILRVSSKEDKLSDYRLSVTRKGLTDEGYRGQLDLAYAAIAEPDSPTFYGSLNQHLGRLRSFSIADGKASERKASEQKINEATAVLDRLRAFVPDKPDAYSMLAAIQLYYRKDLTSARNLATRSLELGGEARFRVNFGERLDRDRRRITDAKFPCWLIIKKGKVSCEGFKQNEGEVFNSKPEWIAKKSLDIPLYSFGLMIYGEAKKKESRNEKREYELFEVGSYYFLPLSALDIDARVPLTEVSTIKSFIKQFVEIRKEDTKQKKKD